jgi:eukaryotic-like serine/threonine-protein kinase
VANPERWKKIKEIVGEALERGPGEREPFVREACAHDESLRAEVESLLSASEKSNGLSEPAFAGQPFGADAHESKFIGPYQLIRKLGEGGMGQVWLAEQTAPVRRQVALKLIRAGVYDEALLQRFQSERQALAMMDHPAIAKVFDAGATSGGQPYFVMEYVPGLPITEYCDQKKMPIRERLELFTQACEGVQHAHHKAIIHRDLKPANILVLEIDGKAMPRIIDFGLAKAVTPSSEGQTLFTQAGSFLGTPGYMSPEQTDPEKDVDTRTDVYSLGVVLYVLLTGALPFDGKHKRPLDEMLQQLREEDPPRPSTKISAANAMERGTEPAQLASELRGDLDWITMKAIDRDRSRRYGSPAELAADVQRYLRNEPIVARPASTGYRLRKYVRRHRIMVAAAAVIAGLLVASALVQAVELQRTTRERNRANRVTDFMTGMFKVSDPSEARGNSVTAREILDNASHDIESGLANDPQLQAQMMGTMANVYINLGLYSRAQGLLERAADIAGRDRGPADRQALRYSRSLGWVLKQEGHPADSEKILRRTLEIQRRAFGPEDPDTLNTMEHLSETLLREGHLGESESLAKEVLAVQRRALGSDHRDTLTTMANLGGALLQEGKFEEAEQLLRETLERQRRIVGPENLGTLSTANNLATALTQMKRYEDAEQLFLEVVRTDLRILGPDHPETALANYNLACLNAHLNRPDETLTYLRASLGHGMSARQELSIESDPDLSSLHGDPRFEAMMADIHRRFPTSQNSE